MTLGEQNQAMHHILDEKYLVFLEELTGCYIDASRRAVIDFRDALFLQLNTEKSLVCPAFLDMGIEGGKRNFARSRQIRSS